MCEAQLGPSSGSFTVAPHTGGLTFEQQKELTLQFEQDKLRRQETLELEKLQQSTERMKLELKQSKVQLIHEGRFSSGVFSTAATDTGSGGADIAACLRFST